jgi:hypothetical protein
VVLVSHFCPPFVFQFFSLQRFWASPHFSLNCSFPCPFPCVRPAQNLFQWPQLFQCFGDRPHLAVKHLTPRTMSCLYSSQNLSQWILFILDPPILSSLQRIPISLQPCVPLSRLENSQRTQSASTLVDV